MREKPSLIYRMHTLTFPIKQRILLRVISWILVNTGGNLNDALRYGRQSVEYEPGQSYSIDTLATCYFALEEFDRAIEYERLAVRLTPYREDIIRTLERFQAGKAAKNGN